MIVENSELNLIPRITVYLSVAFMYKYYSKINRKTNTKINRKRIYHFACVPASFIWQSVTPVSLHTAHCLKSDWILLNFPMCQIYLLILLTNTVIFNINYIFINVLWRLCLSCWVLKGKLMFAMQAYSELGYQGSQVVCFAKNRKPNCQV